VSAGGWARRHSIAPNIAALTGAYLLAAAAATGLTGCGFRNECEPADYPRCHGTELKTCALIELGSSLETRDCATDGLVCATANGTAGCALPSLTPCARNGGQCSSDGHRFFWCNGMLGYVESEHDCSAEGEECRQNEDRARCVILSEPCSGLLAHCAADGARVVECDIELGYFAPGEACTANEICVDSADGNRAACVDVSLTPCQDAEGATCSADRMRVVGYCNVTVGYHVAGTACAEGKRCRLDGLGEPQCQ
jgi:hypothetical protein